MKLLHWSLGVCHWELSQSVVISRIVKIVRTHILGYDAINTLGICVYILEKLVIMLSKYFQNINLTTVKSNQIKFIFHKYIDILQWIPDNKAYSWEVNQGSWCLSSWLPFKRKRNEKKMCYENKNCKTKVININLASSLPLTTTTTAAAATTTATTTTTKLQQPPLQQQQSN